MCLAIDAAIYIANKITKRNKECEKTYTVDFYKLHKLLYFSQGIMLAEYDKRLFKEDITAHSCGAYISSFCGEQYVGGLDPFYSVYADKKVSEQIDNPSGQMLTLDRKIVLEYVAERYGTMESDNIIVETKKHTPYIEAYETKTEDNPKPIMDDGKIKEYFLANKEYLYPDMRI